MPDSVTLASFSPWKDVGDVSGSDLNFKDLGELSSPWSPRQPGPRACYCSSRERRGLGNGIPPQPPLSELNSKG